MALPQDLKFDPSEPDKDNQYIFVDISPLNVGTPYKFQFQWIFEDEKLNEYVGEEYGPIYDYISKVAAKPTTPTNLAAVWEGDTLKVTFDHDNSFNNGVNNNTAVDKYKITFTYNGPLGSGGQGTVGVEGPFTDFWSTFDKNNITKTYKLTRADQRRLGFSFFRDQFTITVIAVDTLNGTESLPAGPYLSPKYAGSLCKPTILQLVAQEFSYDVQWKESCDKTLEEINRYIASINIEEIVTNSATAPASNDPGWTLVKSGLDNPITVPTPVVGKRWVRAYFLETTGKKTDYSDPVSVTTTDPIADAIDNTPPPNVISVTASWNGGNLELTPTFAATDVSTNVNDYSVRFLIDLTGTLNGNTVTKTFFIWRTDMVGTKVIISALDIYNRFGSCAYTSFTGIWKGADKADNINTGTAFSSGTRTSSLSGVTPTISASDITALADGFSIKFTLPAGATHAKVYKRTTSWGNPSGTPTITPTTAEIGGSGVSPVYVADTTYQTIYVRLAFANDCGDLSNFSNELTTSAVNPVTLDTTPPPVPTVSVATPTLSGTKYQAVATITQTGTDTKEYRVRYKPSSSTMYQTILVKYVSASTTTTIADLLPSTTYNISVASVDAANNTSAYSTDVNFTTGALAVDAPASATLTASTAGAVGSWTAPAVIRAPISRYKVELWQDLATDVLISREYSYSLNMSFGGLAAGSYYIKVFAEDSYGTESTTAATSSTVVISGVGTSDGLVPSSSPQAIVNPLYGALEVKWTAVANADPVSYEVYLSSSPITSVVPANLALRVTGTFAIIDTLPGTSNALSYNTTYYVRIRATDADGPATTLGVEGSATTLQIDNGDLKADSIRANVIKAGEITATQINAEALLSNKIITVGARSAIVTSAAVTGTSPNIIITYTTSGTHGFGNGTLVTVTGMTNNSFNITNFTIQSVTSNTFVVPVGGSGATGTLTSQSGVATSTVNTAIKIDASGTGLAANPFKFYSGAGIYNDSGTSPGTPFYLDSTGQFSLRDKLTFNPTSSTLTVNGTINASAGNFAGYMTVNNGTMLIGKGVNPINIPSTGQGANTLDGFYINNNNYWFSGGTFSVGATNNTVTWNGTALTVTGAINARSGNFQGNVKVTDGSVYNGTEITAKVTAYSGSGGQATYTTDIAHGIGTGVVITVSGLTGANSSSFNGTFITQAGTTASTIVANPQVSTNTIPNQAQVTGQSGALLNVSSGYILNTKGLTFGNNTIIDAATGRLITTSANIGGWIVDSAKLERISGTYTGMSSSGTYAFYAGANASGGPTSDIGASFWVKPDGSMRASNISLVGSGTTADFINAGGGVFKVTQSGALTATSAEITGKVTASSGKIGNINIDSASLYISSSATPAVTTGDRMIFNAGGIGAYPSTDSTSSGLTGTETTQAGFGTANFALTRNGTAMFKKGFIAGWSILEAQTTPSVLPARIQSSDGTRSISLRSDAQIILNNSTYFVGLKPQATTANDIVMWAGESSDGVVGTPNFTVSAAGILNAKSAILTGRITAGSGLGQVALGTGAYSPNAVSVTSASGSGSLITYTSSTSHNFNPGMQVTITGMANTLFNQTAAIINSVPTSNTFTVASSQTGTTTSATTNNCTAFGHGIHITAGGGTAVDYIYGTGHFKLGGGLISGSSTQLRIAFGTGTTTFPTSHANYGLNAVYFDKMPAMDGDLWGGDATITVRDSDGRIVKGRRIIYDSSISSANTPVNPSTYIADSFVTDASTGESVNRKWQAYGTGLGYYFGSSTNFQWRPVKSGDILIVVE